ncbi:hypothetical protein [Chryseobacterium carnipullorum]|uniref:hypothetical protein n=1 Tax=Chryseobacterium carnipullorum TaxID=1124835 RepID=UPI003C6C5686
MSEKIGEINAHHLYKPATELRKKNRIKTIQSSLEIEGNTLTEEQVTALLENKRIIAPLKDIQEVHNAIEVYERLKQFNPNSLKDLEKAHAILMKDLIDNAGKFILEALQQVLQSQNTNLTTKDRISIFKENLKRKKFSRKDYLQYFKNISAPTASRDLKWAVEQGVLEKYGEQRLTEYQFIG